MILSCYLIKLYPLKIVIKINTLFTNRLSYTFNIEIQCSISTYSEVPLFQPVIYKKLYHLVDRKTSGNILQNISKSR